MKSLRNAVAISLAVLITACANPVDWATSKRYSRICAECEQDGRLTAAEGACRRALVNAYRGNLNDSVKSERMYDLGRIIRQLRRFDEAEQLYKEALAIEERSTPVSDERVGRLALELAIIYESQRRLEKGLPYVEWLLPLADAFQGEEKRTVAAIFYIYSRDLPEQAPSDLRARLAHKAVEMGFDPRGYFDSVKVVYYARDARATRTAQQIGDWTEALEYSSRAYEEALAANAPDSTLVVALYEYGRSAGVVCKFNEAEEALLESVQLMQQSDHPAFIGLIELARLNLDQGKWAQASNYFEEALAELDRVQAKFEVPHDYADILDEYALARHHLIDEAGAVALEEQAAELRAGAPQRNSTWDRTPYGTHCKMYTLIGFTR